MPPKAFIPYKHRVFFRIKKLVPFGKGLYISGNIRELGSNDPAKAVRMENLDEQFWVAEIKINPNQIIESNDQNLVTYEYFIANYDDQYPQKESICSVVRSFDLENLKENYIKIEDEWLVENPDAITVLHPKNMLFLNLAIRKNVAFGEALYGIGPLEHLGTQDPLKSVRMEWHENHIWRATFDIDLDTVFALQGKMTFLFFHSYYYKRCQFHWNLVGNSSQTLKQLKSKELFEAARKQLEDEKFVCIDVGKEEEETHIESSSSSVRLKFVYEHPNREDLQNLQWVYVVSSAFGRIKMDKSGESTWKTEVLVSGELIIDGHLKYDYYFETHFIDNFVQFTTKTELDHKVAPKQRIEHYDSSSDGCSNSSFSTVCSPRESFNFKESISGGGYNYGGSGSCYSNGGYGGGGYSSGSSFSSSGSGNSSHYGGSNFSGSSSGGSSYSSSNGQTYGSSSRFFQGYHKIFALKAANSPKKIGGHVTNSKILKTPKYILQIHSKKGNESNSNLKFGFKSFIQKIGKNSFSDKNDNPNFQKFNKKWTPVISSLSQFNPCCSKAISGFQDFFQRLETIANLREDDTQKLPPLSQFLKISDCQKNFKKLKAVLTDFQQMTIVENKCKEEINSLLQGSDEIKPILDQLWNLKEKQNSVENDYSEDTHNILRVQLLALAKKWGLKQEFSDKVGEEVFEKLKEFFPKLDEISGNDLIYCCLRANKHCDEEIQLTKQVGHESCQALMQTALKRNFEYFLKTMPSDTFFEDNSFYKLIKKLITDDFKSFLDFEKENNLGLNLKFLPYEKPLFQMLINYCLLYSIGRHFNNKLIGTNQIIPLFTTCGCMELGPFCEESNGTKMTFKNLMILEEKYLQAKKKLKINHNDLEKEIIDKEVELVAASEKHLGKEVATMVQIVLDMKAIQEMMDDEGVDVIQIDATIDEISDCSKNIEEKINELDKLDNKEKIARVRELKSHKDYQTLEEKFYNSQTDL